jgi:catechol 2,3-dioxygenase-like lactoylglutathione lyase family enzyme
MTALRLHCILYVADQAQSTFFWTQALEMPPTLDVPGMTEFRISESCVLGLMPVEGIRRLLGAALPDPATSAGIPRAEVYLVVDDAAACHARCLAAGAYELSPLQHRDWGAHVAYALDPDGHVIAWAEEPSALPM